MLENLPSESGQTQAGTGLAGILRDCLLPGLILVDPRRRLATLTRSAQQLLGAAASQGMAVPLASLPLPLAQLGDAPAPADRSPCELQVEVMHPTRGALTLCASIFPAENEAQRPMLIVVLSDLTSAHRWERQLERLDRLSSVGTLAASAAHEIKNALVAGKTFIDLLLEKHQDGELVDIVRREISRIDAIISRMLNFSGPGRAAFGVVHVHEVLEHSLRLVQPQRESKSIRLERSLQAACDTVMGDEQELQQAAVNLLLNGLESMGPDGALTIVTENCAAPAELSGLGGSDATACLNVRIQDTGSGIRPEHLPRLFEPFFTTKPAGTGIGLFITQRIVRDHRGVIKVESQPGRGTIFHVVLPTCGPAK
jgi:two-component system, NtrC family, nitrogen regulation sensor histidine kinase GlnL